MLEGSSALLWGSHEVRGKVNKADYLLSQVAPHLHLPEFFKVS
jgi:hypothetical protein